MPLKIKKLKAALDEAGFVMRPGKGSHTVWKHRPLPGVEITLAGHDGDDAKLYQIRDVQNALKQIGIFKKFTSRGEIPYAEFFLC